MKSKTTYPSRVVYIDPVAGVVAAVELPLFGWSV
jgi:hypothetical protein